MFYELRERKYVRAELSKPYERAVNDKILYAIKFWDLIYQGKEIRNGKESFSDIEDLFVRRIDLAYIEKLIDLSYTGLIREGIITKRAEKIFEKHKE